MMVEEFAASEAEVENIIAKHNASVFDEATGDFVCSCHGRGRIRWVSLAWR